MIKEALQSEHRASAMLQELRRAGLKMTPQRLAIVELFARAGDHPTAQALFERLRKRYPTLSFATVYNTLDVLTRSNLAGTLRLGGAARFDPNTLPHHHAVCDGCGAILDIPAKSIVPPADAVKRVQTIVPGFSVHGVERIYRGYCAACAKSFQKRELKVEQSTRKSKDIVG